MKSSTLGATNRDETILLLILKKNCICDVIFLKCTYVYCTVYLLINFT